VLDSRERRVSVSVMADGTGHCIRMALEESLSKRAADLLFHFHKADGDHGSYGYSDQGDRV
jgi:hypothetical protein